MTVSFKALMISILMLDRVVCPENWMTLKRRGVSSTWKRDIISNMGGNLMSVINELLDNVPLPRIASVGMRLECPARKDRKRFSIKWG
jgi:hypothetical protein